MKTLIKIIVFTILVLFLISLLPELLGAVVGIGTVVLLTGGLLFFLGAGLLAIPIALAVGALALLATLGLPFLLLLGIVLLLLTPFILFFKVVC